MGIILLELASYYYAILCYYFYCYILYIHNVYVEIKEFGQLWLKTLTTA